MIIMMIIIHAFFTIFNIYMYISLSFISILFFINMTIIIIIIFFHYYYYYFLFLFFLIIIFFKSFL